MNITYDLLHGNKYHFFIKHVYLTGDLLADMLKVFIFATAGLIKGFCHQIECIKIRITVFAQVFF